MCKHNCACQRKMVKRKGRMRTPSLGRQLKKSFSKKSLKRAFSKRNLKKVGRKTGKFIKKHRGELETAATIAKIAASAL